MRTKSLTFLLLLSSPTVFAQYWNDNGNSISSAEWLGSDNNFPLNIRVNSTLVGSFTTAGNFNLVNATNAFQINSSNIY